VEIGIGLINRVAQQLNAFYFSMPIKGVIAALMLAILVSFWADALRDHITGWSRLLPAWDAAWR
jgi:type III secretion protein T